MMSPDHRIFRRPFALVLASTLSAATLLHAQEADPSGSAAADLSALGELSSRHRSSPNVTVDLIKRLVARGVLPKEEGEDLLLQAEADAAEARAQAALTQAALAQAAAGQARIRALAARMSHRGGLASSSAPRADVPEISESTAEAMPEPEEEAPPPVVRAPAPRRRAAPRVVAPVEEEPEEAPAPVARAKPAPRVRTVAPAPREEVEREPEMAEAPRPPAALRRSPRPAAPQPKEEPLEDDEVRVAYVPESVKAQLRAEIKQDVMEQARAENWASPRMMPDWVMRFRFFGDLRSRFEGQYYPTGNDNTGAFPNFNAINTGAPFDTTGTVFSPQYNVDQNRNRLRLRARLGAEMDMGSNYTAGLRIATGENNSPVTQNQSLGLPSSGQGGNFSKYAIWLDRAFLKYEMWGQPDKDLAFNFGRFENPFLSTNMIWADDLGFDGIMAQGKFPLGDDFNPFFAAGAFPVFNTDLNFASNQPAKFKSDDKWLYGAQVGMNFEISKDFSAKIGAAYYFFRNVEGKRSTPFTPVTTADAGDTDASRPSFAQKGNTYMALRDITPNSLNNFGTINQFQYYGLATPFREMAITAKLDFNAFEPFQVSLIGEYVKNLSFDAVEIGTKAVNNLGPNTSTGKPGSFLGSGSAWNVNLKLGRAVLQQRWDWNVTLGYRNVGSDAVIDGFADSDFGGGGTNVKGFTLAGSLALSPRVWVGARWMSATEVAGPRFKNDVLQVDLNGKF